MRIIKSEEFMVTDYSTIVLDVRRANDYETSNDIIPDAIWKDPTKIDEWIDSIPKDKEVVIFCVHGGSVSDSVVDRLRAGGIKARLIEGGIEGLKEEGGLVVKK